MYYNGENKINKIPIIIEFGSYNIRIGYSGSDKPLKMIRSDCLHYIDNNEVKFNHENLLFLSDSEKIENSKIINPFKNRQYDENFLLYFDSIMKENNINLENKNILIVEPPNNESEFKIKLTENWFENYKISGLTFFDSASTASFYHYKESSLIVDIGGYNSYITPIFEGQILESASVHTPMGGENLTELLFDHMETNFRNVFDYRFFLKNNIPLNLKKFAKMNFVRDIKHACLKLPIYGIKNFNFNPVVDNFIFESAQKNNVILGRECYSISENLFDQINLEGIRNSLINSIEKIDPEKKKEILNNIIVVGGATSTPNFIERLQNEIIDILGESSVFYKTKYYSCNSSLEKINTSWMGASIISTTEEYNNLLMTRTEYNEHGSLLIEKKNLNIK